MVWGYVAIVFLVTIGIIVSLAILLVVLTDDDNDSPKAKHKRKHHHDFHIDNSHSPKRKHSGLFIDCEKKCDKPGFPKTCFNDKQCGNGKTCNKYPGQSEGICLETPPIGEMCLPGSNTCGSGATCGISKVVDAMGNNLYPQVNYSIIDLVDMNDNSRQLAGEVILLLDNRSFIIDRDNRLKLIQSDIAMIRIIQFAGYLYGVGEDERLYRLSLGCNKGPKNGVLNWNLMSWAPKQIVHVSSTFNNEYLWIQTRLVEGDSESQGWLYKARDDVNGIPVDPELIEKQRVIGIRNYGNSANAFIQFDPEYCTATIFPQGKPLGDVCYGNIVPNGGTFNITRKNKNKFFVTRSLNGAGVYITHRLCQ